MLKYIITKDLKHFKSEVHDHQVIALKHGYSPNDIVETGSIDDHVLRVWECYNAKHRNKIYYTKFIALEIERYTAVLQARAIETRKVYGITNREGD